MMLGGLKIELGRVGVSLVVLRSSFLGQLNSVLDKDRRDLCGLKFRMVMR